MNVNAVERFLECKIKILLHVYTLLSKAKLT